MSYTNLINKPGNTNLGNRELFSNQYTYTDAQGNKVDTKYYSATDAEIYFGNTFIDEVTYITYQVSQNIAPIYGYNSYIFDDVAFGSRMIQGQFGINFTKSNFLSDVLKSLKTVAKFNAEVNTVSGDAITDHENNPLWGRSFDIWLKYGDSEKVNMVLKNVVVSSVEQKLVNGGDPSSGGLPNSAGALIEVYSFMAQDIVDGSLDDTGAIIVEETIDLDNSATDELEFKLEIDSITYKTNSAGSGIFTINYNANNDLILNKITLTPLLDNNFDSIVLYNKTGSPITYSASKDMAAIINNLTTESFNMTGSILFCYGSMSNLVQEISVPVTVIKSV